MTATDVEWFAALVLILLGLVGMFALGIYLLDHGRDDDTTEGD